MICIIALFIFFLLFVLVYNLSMRRAPAKAGFPYSCLWKSSFLRGYFREDGFLDCRFWKCIWRLGLYLHVLHLNIQRLYLRVLRLVGWHNLLYQGADIAAVLVTGFHQAADLLEE